MTTAAEILGLNDLGTKSVHVKQWDRLVRVRELDLEQGMILFSKAAGDKVMLSGDDIARIVAWAVIDENGNRVFSDKDIPKLAHKNRDAMMHLYQEIMGLSGSVDDAEKNSKASRR